MLVAFACRCLSSRSYSLSTAAAMANRLASALSAPHRPDASCSARVGAPSPRRSAPCARAAVGDAAQARTEAEPSPLSRAAHGCGGRGGSRRGGTGGRIGVGRDSKALAQRALGEMVRGSADKRGGGGGGVAAGGDAGVGVRLRCSLAWRGGLSACCRGEATSSRPRLDASSARSFLALHPAARLDNGSGSSSSSDPPSSSSSSSSGCRVELCACSRPDSLSLRRARTTREGAFEKEGGG